MADLLDKMLTYFESDDFVSYMKNRMEESDRRKEKVSTDEYCRWLYRFTLNSKHKCWDDEIATYTFEGDDKENGIILSSFLKYVKDLAYKQRVLNVTDKDNEFETDSYVIKLYNRYFEISQMCGQGTIVSFRLVDKPDFYTVNVR